MDQQPPSLEMVYLAVETLYNNADSTDKEKTNRWLQDLQKSVYSWKIADEMLHDRRSLESCYFAAQTMRTKVQYAFHELPPESHTSLRDSLLEHVRRFSGEGHIVIMRQLCIALSGIALQMPGWHKAVLDLLKQLSSPEHILPLLEILTVLPEELQSSAVWLGANRRQAVLEELKTSAAAVLELWNMCLLGFWDSNLVRIRVIRCFASWATANALPLADVLSNAIVAECFRLLGEPKCSHELHDAAADCVCELLDCLVDNNNQHALDVQFFSSVMALEPGYHLAVATEDQERALMYCRIFTTLGESFLEKIIENCADKEPGYFAVKALDLILTCVGHHDFELVSITLSFWYRLSEELYQKKNDALTEMFRPHIERLVAALCRHCQMEPDQEGLLDDADDFKDFRCKVSDLIKDVVFIIGGSHCFKQMFLSLQSPSVTWDSTEAALFVMQAVAKNILPEENGVVPQVVEAILNLPPNTHVAVRFTSVLLLGELCEWIDQHPDTLQPSINFLLLNLQQAGVAGAAATALQNVCEACRRHMAKQVPLLVVVLQQADQLAITNDGVIGLLKGVTCIMGCSPPEELRPALRELCRQQTAPLEQLVEHDVILVRQTRTDPVLWLDRLAAVFRALDGKGARAPACRDVTLEIWPVLSKTFDKYRADLKIMERCCRCIRGILRCLGCHARHLLEPIVQKIVVLYQYHGHSCYLYIGSILVDEFAGEPADTSLLLKMLTDLIQPTFELLKQHDGLRNNPGTVDDFFRLCSRFVQKAARPFLACPALPTILECAIMSSALDHREANKTVMRFFCDLVRCGRGADAETRCMVEQVMHESGQRLVTALLLASVFSLPTYMLAEVAEVFVEAMAYDAGAFGVWLETAVRSLPTTNAAGCVTATQVQLAEFHSTTIRAESTKSVTYILRDFVRLYR